MTSPKTVKNRDRGRRGGESGRRTIYKLISIRKKSQVIGTFLPLNFWVIWAYHYLLSSAECTPNFEYTQPLDFKKVLFLPLNSRWYLSPLSLSFYERSTMLLSPFLFCTYCMTRPRDSGLDLTNMLLVAQLSIMPFSFQNLFNHCYCDHLDITSRCCIIVIYITIITNPH